MRRCILLLALAAAGCAPRVIARPDPGAPWRGPVRDIPACLLIDRAAPPPEDIVHAAMTSASDDFRAHAGVSFRAAAVRPYDADVSLDPLSQARRASAACPAGAELFIVFSDRPVRKGDTYSSTPPLDPDAQLAGQSQGELGLILMYRVRDRSDHEDAAGNVAFHTALRHELGHVFGLVHTADRRSFMHAPSENSDGAWTVETVAAMRANRMRRWHVPPEATASEPAESSSLVPAVYAED